MPIGVISEELKRQAQPLADIETEYVNDIPFDQIDIDNYRTKKSERYLMELANSIANNGLLQEPGLVMGEDGRWKLAFGQCRVLACRDFLQERTLKRAKTWPVEALPYIKTIALIENMERQDTTLADEIAGLNDVLKTEYQGFDSPVIGFCEQTGRNIDEIRNKLKIYEAAKESNDIADILEQEKIKDYKSLYNLAVAKEAATNAARQKRVQEFMKAVMKDQVSGSMRKATEKLRQFAKGKIDSSALPSSVARTDPKMNEAGQGEKATKPGKPKPVLSAKQILSFTEKLNKLDQSMLDDDTQAALKALTESITRFPA